jgi:hypothetical protein
MTAMIECTERHYEAMRHAITEASRISCDGGTGSVELPDPDTGNLTRQQLDQKSARELLAVFNGNLMVTARACDTLMVEIWTAILAGNSIAAAARESLREWTAATLADAEGAEREMSKGRRAALMMSRDEALIPATAAN